MKRVILPNHNLFYTALLALDHLTTETNYEKIVFLLTNELNLKQHDRTLMPFNDKMENAQISKSIQNTLNGTQPPAWNRHTQFRGGPSGPGGSHHGVTPLEFAGTLLSTLAGPLVQSVFPKPVHNFTSLKTPNHGPDPDRCICKEASCQTLADVIREQSKAFGAETTNLMIQTKYKRFLTHPSSNLVNITTPYEYVHMKRALTNDLIAKNLWEAAQTYGRITKLSGDEFDQYYQQLLLTNTMMPTVEVTHKGCPKAISTIAAILGDLNDGSNYIRTLAAISTIEGIKIISKMITSSKMTY